MEQNKPMRKFRVKVVTVPPRYMVELGIAKAEESWQMIEGRTLADAKERAGIQ